MTTPIEFRTMPLKELRDRLDALEDETELVRAVIRQREKQERSRERVAQAIAATQSQEVTAHAS